MLKSELKSVVIEQNEFKVKDDLVEREAFQKMVDTINEPFVTIISGIRRCGKSTLIHQTKSVMNGYYLNFDDERLLDFTVRDFQDLLEIFTEVQGEKDIFYFDEIQNVDKWERFVRRLHDNRKKVFVTGSNASMLSKELGTHLTGRYTQTTLYPFSFREFLTFKKIDVDDKNIHLTEKKGEIKREFSEYMEKGGFPEYLKTNNPEHLQLLYKDILYKDVMVRYNLSDEKTMRELGRFIATNIAKKISFNSIKRMLNLGSSTTVKEYLGYLENSYLAFLIPKFHYSLKKQIYSPKKIYLVDTGMAKHLGYRFSKDDGRILENLVFIELKRRKKEIAFHEGKFECDFVCFKNRIIEDAIQVCYELHKDNKEREIQGMLEALKKYKLDEGLLLTMDQREDIKIQNKIIKVKPVWEWLLETV